MTTKDPLIVDAGSKVTTEKKIDILLKEYDTLRTEILQAIKMRSPASGKDKNLYNVADELGRKFGKHTLHLGGSHPIDKSGKGRRGNPTIREQTQLKGETRRRHLGLPLLHVKS